jgi:redox-sensitive bicupin YhaK (pirin superfamily)
MYAGLFDGDERAELGLAADRLAYVHVARGEIVVNGQKLETGDALMLKDETSIALGAGKDAEVLVFDLPQI